MKNSTHAGGILLLFAIVFNLTARAQFGNTLSYTPNQYVTMPNGIVSGIATSFTIEAWVYWRGGAAYQRIFDFGNSTNDGYMYLTPSNGSNVAFGFAIPGHPERQLSGGSIPLNTWTHVAVIVDYSQTDFFGHGPVGYLYVNGVIANPGGGGLYDPGDPGFIGYTPAALADVSETNWLGRPRSFFDPYFDGMIDEFRISSVVRYTGNFTPPTIPFTTDASTVALYHFDEGSGQFAAEVSGNPALDAFLGAVNTPDAADPSWLASTLPIKLIQFTAQKSERAAHLKWRAASTGEQGKFVVERSTDGSHFQSIGTVPFTGGYGTFNYSFDDYTFNGEKNYYRLKIQENNLAAKYSAVVLVNMSLTNRVYPTIAGSYITVTVPAPETISLFNAAGVLVKKLRLPASQNVDVSSLSRGVYYMRFEESSQTVQFIKQ
jgi:hypothetical protein